MAKSSKSKKNAESRELLEALTILEKEKNISKDTLLEAIENSLLTACKNHFGKADNIKVTIDPETCEFHVYAEKTVVQEVTDPLTEISFAEAMMIGGGHGLGDVIHEEIQSKDFGRIATQNAKNVILQKIREEERKVIFDQYYGMSKDIVTGIVQRYIGNNVSIDLGKVDAVLSENEMIPGETFEPTERIKVYVIDVKSTSKGPKVLVSRTHPELVKRLFEAEVAEVRDGIVEIKSIAREAGSRTKMAVWSNDPDVDPVGACVGMNGARVNAIVEELNGEKIDIINWNENPAMLIENALSPAKVISVIADAEENKAKVVVPDYQLSLAIGKEGQNARLAARLTGFKIDIKSETQAREAGDFMDYEEDYEDEELNDIDLEDMNEFFVAFHGTFEHCVAIFRILIGNAFYYSADFYRKMLWTLLHFYSLRLYVFSLYLMTVCLIIYRLFRFLTNTSICCFRCLFSGFLHTLLLCLTHLRHHTLIHFLVHIAVIQCSMRTFR